VLVDTALAAAVPRPGERLLFRSRRGRTPAREPDPNAPTLEGGIERSRTRAAVAAASAVAVEARMASPIPAAAAPAAASLAGVVRLRTGEGAVRLVSPLAAQALARADILPCASWGGVDVDGVHWLRTIGMFEVLRYLAASVLARTVRKAAARLLEHLQMGVCMPKPCERVIHEVGAKLAHRTSAVLLQLDFKNSFSLDSFAAVVAYMLRAIAILRPYRDSVHLSATAPRVHGWLDGDAAADAADGAPARLWLDVQRGVQKGDPLGLLSRLYSIVGETPCQG